MIKYIISISFFLMIFSCANINHQLGIVPNCSACLVITEADLTYTSGSLSIMDLENFQIGTNIYEIYPDSQVKTSHQQEVFILERFGRDNIKKMDPKNHFKILFEEKVASNPYDVLMFENNLGVLTSYNSSSLYFFDGDTGKQNTTFSLNLQTFSDFALPEVSFLFKKNNFIYVILQNLGTTSNPNELLSENRGQLIKINMSNKQVVRRFEMPCKNPISKIKNITYNQKDILYMTCVDRWFTQGDEGIIAFDVDREEFLTSRWLGDVGDVVNSVIINDTKGYALVLSLNWPFTDLISFNPSTNKIMKTLISNKSLAISLELYQNKLIIGDKTLENHGIRIFDTQTDIEITNQPIRTGLLPESFSIVNN